MVANGSSNSIFASPITRINWFHFTGLLERSGTTFVAADGGDRLKSRHFLTASILISSCHASALSYKVSTYTSKSAVSFLSAQLMMRYKQQQQSGLVWTSTGACWNNTFLAAATRFWVTCFCLSQHQTPPLQSTSAQSKHHRKPKSVGATPKGVGEALKRGHDQQ